MMKKTMFFHLLGWTALTFCAAAFVGCGKSTTSGSVLGERGHPTRFSLDPAVDVLGVEDGATLLVNLPGAHPLLGRQVPVRIRGVEAPRLPPSDPARLDEGIKAWDRMRRLMEGARTVELRMLERGRTSFMIVADLYVDGTRVLSESSGTP